MRGTSGELARVVRDVAEATPGLLAAYLFGSTVRDPGNARDVDVALLWPSDLDSSLRWRRAEALAMRLEVKIGRPVDIVDLRAAPPVVRQRILSEGRLAFEDDRVGRIRFEAEAISTAIDFVEWQRPYLDRWLKVVGCGR